MAEKLLNSGMDVEEDSIDLAGWTDFMNLSDHRVGGRRVARHHGDRRRISLVLRVFVFRRGSSTNRRRPEHLENRLLNPLQLGMDSAKQKLDRSHAADYSFPTQRAVHPCCPLGAVHAIRRGRKMAATTITAQILSNNPNRTLSNPAGFLVKLNKPQ